MAVRGRALVALALLALTLPLFAVKAWASAYADALGDGIAAQLIAVVPTLPPPPDEGGSAEPTESEPPASDGSGARGVAVDSNKRSRQPAHARATPVRGIRISAGQVLALAARRAMPHAVFVKANAEHPAGLLLAGVSALGVGLQDGDVLTEAAGQKATSVPAVVGIVLAARSRQASEISGRFYRAGVPFLLTVEQPYPKQPVPG
jgi:hypothetical protein